MKKIIEGIIVSVKMKNTATVEVTRYVPHPLYKKLQKKSRKHKVETKGLVVEVGNRVRFTQARPLSKDKHFSIVEVVK